MEGSLTSNNPLSQTTAVPRITFLVDVSDELRLDVPVASKIEVLYGVHGQVLELRDLELRGEQVKIDQVPMQVLAATIPLGLVDKIVEVASLVDPVAEQIKHIRALILQCYDKVRRAVVEFHPR